MCKAGAVWGALWETEEHRTPARTRCAPPNPGTLGRAASLREQGPLRGCLQDPGWELLPGPPAGPSPSSGLRDGGEGGRGGERQGAREPPRRPRRWKEGPGAEGCGRPGAGKGSKMQVPGPFRRQRGRALASISATEAWAGLLSHSLGRATRCPVRRSGERERHSSRRDWPGLHRPHLTPTAGHTVGTIIIISI